ncbi:hypothetical protein [Crenalkalicoccus roseus]|uniref:hypothetical protein n=1 Tax=Crenalkalicoccus roseus TaxID=1485588 RepID=UPI001080E15D|nr:hypothetical protein [Crenalkalicoccus roseus]
MLVKCFPYPVVVGLRRAVRPRVVRRVAGASAAGGSAARVAVRRAVRIGLFCLAGAAPVLPVQTAPPIAAGGAPVMAAGPQAAPSVPGAAGEASGGAIMEWAGWTSSAPEQPLVPAGLLFAEAAMPRDPPDTLPGSWPPSGQEEGGSRHATPPLTAVSEPSSLGLLLSFTLLLALAWGLFRRATA